MSQLRYWIWLTNIPGLSLRAQLLLVREFADPKEIFLSSREALADSGILSTRELDALDKRDLRRADQVLEDCQRLGIGVLTMQDAAYPARLRAIEMPPLVLYYRGTLLPFDLLPTVAIVGSRKASAYGLGTAKRLGYEIAACGGTVVSGAAKGIDALALEGALSAGRPVAAVLGNGLDIVYPSESRRLYQDILQKGCLISEYIPGSPPLGQNFPRRNRIMSGLSLGVVVVEAPKSSGSLITADFALEQGRDVFAVPGNVGLACCAGSNALIQEGAHLITCGWDVLEGYQPDYPELLRRSRSAAKLDLAPGDQKLLREDRTKPVTMPETAPEAPEKPAEEAASPEKSIDNAEKRNYIDLQQVVDSLSEDERRLMEILSQGQSHVDDIIDESGLSAARVLSSLTLLEVKGYVTQQPGKRFERNLHE